MDKPKLFVIPPVELINDIDDFKMPYSCFGNTALEIMKNKYFRLDNDTKGVIKRHGQKKIRFPSA